MVYHINYRMKDGEPIKFIDVVAKSKQNAYNKATAEAIPTAENGKKPLSAWVVSCTCQNGNYRRFNTTESKPY